MNSKRTQKQAVQPLTQAQIQAFDSLADNWLAKHDPDLQKKEGISDEIDALAYLKNERIRNTHRSGGSFDHVENRLEHQDSFYSAPDFLLSLGQEDLRIREEQEKEEESEFLRCLQAITRKKDQEILLDVFINGCTVKEIAEKYNCTKQAVYSLLKRSSPKLRKAKLWHDWNASRNLKEDDDLADLALEPVGQVLEKTGQIGWDFGGAL